MARLTSDNKNIYLPYKSAEQTVREAIDEHETRFTKLGWISVGTVLVFFFLHDAVLLYICKYLFG